MSLKRCRTCGVLTLALSFGLLVSPPARAQTVDAQTVASAQSLYDQAVSEMDAGQFAPACPKLEEVTRLIPEGLGAKLTLAECYEKTGRLASAWAQYSLVETLAGRTGQAERLREAVAAAAVLKPRLAMLTVAVPAEVRAIAGLVIAWDGVTLGEEQWESALPVDAGAHRLVATAPGRRAWEEAVEVRGEGAPVIVEVKPLVVETVAPAAVEGRRGPEEAPSERAWQRPAALVALGVGVIGVGVGATLGGLAIARNGQSNEGHCNAENLCNQEGFALREQALALGNGSTVAMIAGGALLAGGAVLWFTAPARGKDKGAGELGRARVAVVPGGVLLQGRW
ncbi:hypothetical protein [Chondromyces crocatus]|uniref:PEGA domain-containing protein n=1 Tax=Chondromyces crocatus TaxID=52 RepID=A0A0K1EIG7_CHOCO|nr:hypothetical protein [Chondromyces crocatus]AKT40388.1 uncharacterized protein CMC5_045410 [Chondromyces crocatus]